MRVKQITHLSLRAMSLAFLSIHRAFHYSAKR